MADIIPCVLKDLPKEKRIKAAAYAVAANPANNPPALVAAMALGNTFAPARLAVLVGKRWPADGVLLLVRFLDNPDADLRLRILAHMNAWGTRARVQFIESTSPDAHVRITRADDGYWSYLGTDIQHVPAGEPTMNLQGFTMETRDSEFFRVVRHETGHTLGFPHEHMRRVLVERIDRAKAIAYFGATQGWSPDEVRRQVLTPLEAVKVKRSYRADENSIMCYRIPGAITKSGRPIPGGTDITETDYKFAAAVYPKV